MMPHLSKGDINTETFPSGPFRKVRASGKALALPGGRLLALCSRDSLRSLALRITRKGVKCLRAHLEEHSRPPFETAVGQTSRQWGQSVLSRGRPAAYTIEGFQNVSGRTRNPRRDARTTPAEARPAHLRSWSFLWFSISLLLLLTTFHSSRCCLHISDHRGMAMRTTHPGSTWAMGSGPSMLNRYPFSCEGDSSMYSRHSQSVQRLSNRSGHRA